MYYIQAWSNRVKIQNDLGVVVFDEIPSVAIKQSKKGGAKTILCVGDDVNKVNSDDESILIVELFSHPRSMLNDFYVTQKYFEHVFRHKLSPNKTFFFPSVIFHQMEKSTGGLTFLERRALAEVFLGANAREANIYWGRELQSNEIKNAKLEESSNLRVVTPYAYYVESYSLSEIAIVLIILLIVFVNLI